MADDDNVVPIGGKWSVDILAGALEQMRHREPAPVAIQRPCDQALDLAFIALETQLGTIEAYNRLCRKARGVRARIDRGDIEPERRRHKTDPYGGHGKPKDETP